MLLKFRHLFNLPSLLRSQGSKGLKWFVVLLFKVSQEGLGEMRYLFEWATIYERYSLNEILREFEDIFDCFETNKTEIVWKLLAY